MESAQKATKPLKVFHTIHLISSSSSSSSYSSSTTATSSSSASSSSMSSPFPAASRGPCAACKALRRRCTESCFLAPYFPSTKLLQFITVHKIFGASNIIKLLKEVPESKRADAVSSMVFEANARTHDPVYGCAGTIRKLQTQLQEVQAELAATRAQLFYLECQQQQLNDDANFFHGTLAFPSWEC